MHVFQQRQQGGMGGGGGQGGGFQGDWNRGARGGYGQDGTQYSVPADKCGLVIGKGKSRKIMFFSKVSLY